MAAKKTPAKTATKAPAKAVKATSTPVRNTPIPKVATPAVAARKPDLTPDMIARRAYEIWSSKGGSELDNWIQAESELKAA